MNTLKSVLAFLFILAVCGAWSTIHGLRQAELRIALEILQKAEQRFYKENKKYTYNLYELEPYGWEARGKINHVIGFPKRCGEISQNAAPSTLNCSEKEKRWCPDTDVKRNRAGLSAKIDQYGACPEDRQSYTAVAALNWPKDSDDSYFVYTIGADGKPVKQEPAPFFISYEYWKPSIERLPEAWQRVINFAFGLGRIVLWLSLFFLVNVLSVRYKGWRTLRWGSMVTVAQVMGLGLAIAGIGWIFEIAGFLKRDAAGYGLAAVGLLSIQAPALIFLVIRRKSGAELRWKRGDLWAYLALLALAPVIFFMTAVVH